MRSFNPITHKIASKIPYFNHKSSTIFFYVLALDAELCYEITMLYYLVGCCYCLFCARRMQYKQRGKNTTGWVILQLACLAFLVACMSSISEQAATSALLITLVACPVVASLPALLYSAKHPYIWVFGSTIFNLAIALFFYYLTNVWLTICETPYGHSVPWWVEIWLPSAY